MRIGAVLERRWPDYTSITPGPLDGATGLKLEGHIYCDNAGDYYEIAGGDYKLGQWTLSGRPCRTQVRHSR